jgi:hypothetical protein
VTTAAYGFRFDAPVEARWLALHGADGWPFVTVERGETDTVDAERLVATVKSDWVDDDLIHPVLGSIALKLAEARGLEALHAGAVAGAEGAWGVIGGKERGKSTLLAACARGGLDVMTDDVLTLHDGHCLAGPRAIDLRPDAARMAPDGEWVRGDSRLRLALPPAPAELPLAGFVHLAWGPRLELAPLRPHERLAWLAGRRAADGWPRGERTLLGLANLPTYVLRRPRAWDGIEASAELLAERLALRDSAAA